MTSPQEIYALFKQSTGVCTDSRKIEKGNLFFALSGPNFDGNKYAQKAIDAGAMAAAVDHADYASEHCHLVDDSLKCLQQIAKIHRDHFKNPVLAITGSNGKTTTKELCREVLARKYKVAATEGNLNNHIGVPLTILQWTKETELAIVEMGANHVGEIASYCEYAQPTHGLITNIGHAHTETFGGIEGVLRGKSELFDYLRRTNGIPFINVRDPRLAQMTQRFPSPEHFPASDVLASPSTEYLGLSVGDATVGTNLTGSYNFDNAAAAVSVGRHFDVPEDQIKEALAGYSPSNNRSQILKKGQLTFIVDCYNANPDSMRAALTNLSGFRGNKMAVIGDMNELGNSETEHLHLAKFIAELNLERVILVGEKMRPAQEVLPNSVHYPSASALALESWMPETPATVLLKASRSVKLEELIKNL